MYSYPLPTVTNVPQVVSPIENQLIQNDREREKPKTVQEQIIEEAENLEKPSESVAFLKYMMKHAEKVSTLQQRLQAFRRLYSQWVLCLPATQRIASSATVPPSPHPHMVSSKPPMRAHHLRTLICHPCSMAFRFVFGQ